MEWGEICGSGDHSVVTPYCPCHDLHPFALLLASDYFLDCLKNQSVSSINCCVGLRVVYRCEGDLRIDLLTEILEHGTIEILGIVDGDLLRNYVVTDDVLPEKFLHGGRDYVGYRFRINPFGEVLHFNDVTPQNSEFWNVTKIH
jgi:hypothetical protein